MTKPAANLRRDLDPRWFENTNVYQAENVMGGDKKMGSDLGFQINSLGDALIYGVSPEQRNSERFLSGLPQQAMVNVSDFHGYI